MRPEPRQKSSQENLQLSATIANGISRVSRGNMPKIIAIFLSILILLAGCSTPSTKQNTQPQKIVFTPTHSDLTAESPQPTFTSTLSLQPVDVLNIATTYTPTPSGRLTFEGQTVARIMLDEAYIYWVVDDQLDTIYRTLLNGGL